MKKNKKLFATGKFYNSVAEMIGDIRGPKAQKEFEDMIATYTLSMDLSVLRCKAELSEKEMAARMGVSKKVLVRIENTTNDKLTIGEIERYLQALGVLSVDINANVSHRKWHLSNIIKGT